MSKIFVDTIEPKTSGGNITLSDGSGSMVKLLDATISSAVSEYDISSTYINSTYDEYILSFNLAPSSDNASAYVRTFVGGVIQTGSIYAHEQQQIDGSADNHSDAATQFRLNVSGVGNATGECISGRLHLHNINNTNFPFNYTGAVNHPNTSATPLSVIVGGSLIVANRANVVNGIRLFFNSGNIALGTVKLYGLK